MQHFSCNETLTLQNVTSPFAHNFCFMFQVPILHSSTHSQSLLFSINTQFCVWKMKAKRDKQSQQHFDPRALICDSNFWLEYKLYFERSFPIFQGPFFVRNSVKGKGLFFSIMRSLYLDVAVTEISSTPSRSRLCFLAHDESSKQNWAREYFMKAREMEKEIRTLLWITSNQIIFEIFDVQHVTKKKYFKFQSSKWN